MAHLCVGEAIAARLDPAETPEIRRAYALELWWTLGTLTDEDATGLAEVQSNPQAAVFTRDSLTEAPAAALLFDYLDDKIRKPITRRTADGCAVAVGAAHAV